MTSTRLVTPHFSPGQLERLISEGAGGGAERIPWICRCRLLGRYEYKLTCVHSSIGFYTFQSCLLSVGVGRYVSKEGVAIQSLCLWLAQGRSSANEDPRSIRYAW